MLLHRVYLYACNTAITNHHAIAYTQGLKKLLAKRKSPNKNTSEPVPQKSLNKTFFGPLPQNSLNNTSFERLPHWQRELRDKANLFYEDDKRRGGDSPLQQRPLRNYQFELCDEATKTEQNSIIYLPTGTGKTFVAIEIVNRIMSKAAAAPAPDKKTPLAIFLVDRVPLVFQQSKAFDSQYKPTLPNLQKCGRYVGDMTNFNWPREFETHEVMCFTAGLFRNLLENNNISLRDVTVLVFDEAHHVRKQKGESYHDFNMIMKEFYFEIPVETRPRIVAMTASPGGALTLPSTRRAVHELCFNLVSCCGFYFILFCFIFPKRNLTNF